MQYWENHKYDCWNKREVCMNKWIIIIFIVVFNKDPFGLSPYVSKIYGYHAQTENPILTVSCFLGYINAVNNTKCKLVYFRGFYFFNSMIPKQRDLV